MTYERAAEILDPEHRETYESLEIVNEACRMGRAALFRRMPEPPHPDGDESILACPTCGSGEYLYNEDGNRCCFCGWCGQAIDWNAETFKAAGQMKPVLKYPGSKWRLAEWIVSLMPPHKSYLEPFFGSGAVFFKKPPSRIETINDLDGEIINLFRCIREQPEELMRAVACTPYSRGEYEQAWDHFKAGGQVRPDGIEAARLTLVRYWQAHGSTVVYKGGWKNDRAGREYAYDVRYWRQLPERIAAVAERLKDAQIEQSPAVDVIRRFRHPDVLIYADPPYMLHTRKGKQYIVEMAEEAQHIELLDALKEHPGPVILSGYDNDLYNEHLQGWKMWTEPCAPSTERRAGGLADEAEKGRGAVRQRKCVLPVRPCGRRRSCDTVAWGRVLRLSPTRSAGAVGTGTLPDVRRVREEAGQDIFQSQRAAGGPERGRLVPL